MHAVFLLLLLSLLAPSPSLVVVASPKQSSSQGGSLYDRLGVDRSCTAAQLQKAYRKEALKCHPDKQGGNEAAFKELSHAYEILSDPEKRELYDRYGEAGLDNSPGAAGGFPGNGFFGGQQQGGGQQSFRFKSGSNDIGAEEWLRRFAQQQASGSSSSFRQNAAPGGGIDIETLLREMMGGGGAGVFGARQGPGSSSSSGFGFGGGVPPQQRSPPPQVFERPLQCTLEELAMGGVKKMRIKMPDGRARIVKVQIQKGWKAGTKIKFGATHNFPAVTLVVQQKPHDTLERVDNDLIYRIPADCTIVKITLPDGEVWERRLPQTLRRTKGERITIADKGMPIKGGPARGNLILEFL